MDLLPAWPNTISRGAWPLVIGRHCDLNSSRYHFINYRVIEYRSRHVSVHLDYSNGRFKSDLARQISCFVRRGHTHVVVYYWACLTFSRVCWYQDSVHHFDSLQNADWGMKLGVSAPGTTAWEESRLFNGTWLRAWDLNTNVKYVFAKQAIFMTQATIDFK